MDSGPRGSADKEEIWSAMSASQPPSSVWFEHAQRWGTSMPLATDSPPIQGDVPGPDPARAPPNKAIVQAGLACRGQPAGVYLASQGPPRRSAAAPASGTCPVSVWATPEGTDRSAAVASDTLIPRSLAPSWGTGCVKSADTDEVSSPVCDRSCRARLIRSFVAKTQAAGPGEAGVYPATTPASWPAAPPYRTLDRPFRADCCRFAARGGRFAGGRRRRRALTWGGAEGI